MSQIYNRFNTRKHNYSIDRQKKYTKYTKSSLTATTLTPSTRMGDCNIFFFFLGGGGGGGGGNHTIITAFWVIKRYKFDEHFDKFKKYSICDSMNIYGLRGLIKIFSCRTRKKKKILRVSTDKNVAGIMA